jgi:indole-3-glycerol phosphate synthase
VNRNAIDSNSILRAIVDAKRLEIARLRPNGPSLRGRAESRRPAPDFAAALGAGPGIGVIAEVKRRSPSAGEIRADAPASSVARVYAKAGAAAISVLTDAEFFGGSLVDLEAVADGVVVPLLRKDFTLDPVQVYEARAAGASAVLLIARILDDAQLADLGALAGELQLSVLVEVHDEGEVERALKSGARVIGVNNRDLATFTTDLGVTERLSRYIPAGVLLVSESGIREVSDVEQLAEAGVSAVLVGEALMRAADPAALLTKFAAVQRRSR